MSVDVSLPNGVVVRRVQIIGTQCYTYSAWVPTDFSLGEVGYSTITTIDGRWYGRIGCEPIPSIIERLPLGSVEGIRQWDEFRYAHYQTAYHHIYAAFPTLYDLPCKCDNGDVEYTGGNPA